MVGPPAPLRYLLSLAYYPKSTQVLERYRTLLIALTNFDKAQRLVFFSPSGFLFSHHKVLTLHSITLSEPQSPRTRRLFYQQSKFNLSPIMATYTNSSAAALNAAIELVAQAPETIAELQKDNRALKLQIMSKDHRIRRLELALQRAKVDDPDAPLLPNVPTSTTNEDHSPPQLNRLQI